MGTSVFPFGMKQATRTLTNAEILAGPGISGYAVVPAQGANTVIVLNTACFKSHVVTTGYTATSPLFYFMFDESAVSQVSIGLSASNLLIVGDNLGFDALDGTQASAGVGINQPLMLTLETQGGTISGGNAANTLLVSLTYTVLNVVTGQYI